MVKKMNFYIRITQKRISYIALKRLVSVNCATILQYSELLPLKVRPITEGLMLRTRTLQTDSSTMPFITIQSHKQPHIAIRQHTLQAVT